MYGTVQLKDGLVHLKQLAGLGFKNKGRLWKWDTFRYLSFLPKSNNFQQV